MEHERDDELERLGARVEGLLDELEAALGPTTWPRVEELVTALLGLHGAGLERLLLLARQTAADRSELDRAIGADARLLGLLTLHDLHPDLPALRDARGAPPRAVALIPVERLVRERP